jgi:hypothetical protein
LAGTKYAKYEDPMGHVLVTTLLALVEPVSHIAIVSIVVSVISIIVVVPMVISQVRNDPFYQWQRFILVKMKRFSYE